MLLTLCISHFLTIDSIELDVASGFTVFTGESGAGKSILMDALMFALGAKAEVEVIRQGALQAEVTACFHVPHDSGLFESLLEDGLMDDDGELLIRRVLHRSGRSKSFINGKLSTRAQLQTIAGQLIHIHGQHAHHELHHARTARSQLDRFAQHQDLLQQVEQLFAVYQGCVKEFEAITAPLELKERLDAYQRQREELTGLAIQPNEIDALYDEHKRLHHLKDYAAAAVFSESILSEETGVCAQLHTALQSLKSIPEGESNIQNIRQLMTDALIQCQEALGELSGWLESVTESPERMHEVESRMSQLHQVARKYRVEVRELGGLLEQIQQKCDEIETQLLSIPEIEKRLMLAKQAYQRASEQLRESRQTQALTLSHLLTTMIRELGMGQGEIRIDLQPLEKPSRYGMDKIDYFVKTNPGMSFQPLSKVLSGGELSRVSLAIELKTCESTSMPTFIFDEIDVGIGGKIAATVGRLLRQLGERVQVLCVTHQPQVAAFAHHHFGVKKTVYEEQSHTFVASLCFVKRTEELATMLGGMTRSEEALEHAKSLLMEAQAL